MRKLLWVVFLAPLWAQQGAPPDAAKPRRPMPEPKNLQVLKVSGPQIIGIMRSFTLALGVQCTHCHVQGDFASDDKQQKLTARKMISMSQEINAKFPEGKMRVTCYTCHRGELEPKTAAPEGAEPAKRPGPPPQQ